MRRWEKQARSITHMYVGYGHNLIAKQSLAAVVPRMGGRGRFLVFVYVPHSHLRPYEGAPFEGTLAGAMMFAEGGIPHNLP